MLSPYRCILVIMKYKRQQKSPNSPSSEDLNGKYFAYDLDGTVLGEVVYKKGTIVSKTIYPEKRKGANYQN